MAKTKVAKRSGKSGPALAKADKGGAPRTTSLVARLRAELEDKKRGRSGRKSGRDGASTKAAKGKKRKRQEPESSSDDDDNDESEEDSDAPNIDEVRVDRAGLHAVSVLFGLLSSSQMVLTF